MNVRPLTPDEGCLWDDLLDAAEVRSLFAERWFLDELPAVEYMGVFEGDTLVAGIPVPVCQEGGQLVARQSGLYSPYFVPTVRTGAAIGVRAMERRRRLIAHLAHALQKRYVAVSFPLHPSLTDAVPFQQAHFWLEVRYTFTIDVENLDASWDRMHPSTRNHIRASAARGVAVEIDQVFDRFDLDAALHSDDPAYRRRWERILPNLLDRDRGRVLVAVSGGEVVGGLFLAMDAQCSYNLFSYYLPDAPGFARGVPSLLVAQAMQVTDQFGLSTLDLEGSVLPTIESFFLRFGGRQTVYYGLHWYRDPCRRPQLNYVYE